MNELAKERPREKKNSFTWIIQLRVFISECSFLLTHHAASTPHSGGRLSCLAEQPGLQLPLSAVAHRRPRQDLLSRRKTFSSAISHQERVLAEANRLRVHQALLFFRCKGWIKRCRGASTLGGGGPIRGEMGSLKIAGVWVQTGVGLRVQVAEGLRGFI